MRADRGRHLNNGLAIIYGLPRQVTWGGFENSLVSDSKDDRSAPVKGLCESIGSDRGGGQYGHPWLTRFRVG